MIGQRVARIGSLLVYGFFLTGALYVVLAPFGWWPL